MQSQTYQVVGKNQWGIVIYDHDTFREVILEDWVISADTKEITGVLEDVHPVMTEGDSPGTYTKRYFGDLTPLTTF